jgi:hypothetical protein
MRADNNADHTEPVVVVVVHPALGHRHHRDHHKVGDREHRDGTGPDDIVTAVA